MSNGINNRRSKWSGLDTNIFLRCRWRWSSTQLALQSGMWHTGADRGSQLEQEAALKRSRSPAQTADLLLDGGTIGWRSTLTASMRETALGEVFWGSYNVYG